AALAPPPPLPPVPELPPVEPPPPPRPPAEPADPEVPAAPPPPEAPPPPRPPVEPPAPEVPAAPAPPEAPPPPCPAAEPPDPEVPAAPAPPPAPAPAGLTAGSRNRAACARRAGRPPGARPGGPTRGVGAARPRARGLSPILTSAGAKEEGASPNDREKTTVCHRPLPWRPGSDLVRPSSIAAAEGRFLYKKSSVEADPAWPFAAVAQTQPSSYTAVRSRHELRRFAREIRLVS